MVDGYRPWLQRALTTLFGEGRIDRLREAEVRFPLVGRVQLYPWAVEAAALNSFSYVLAAPIELGAAGMDLPHHALTRGIAAVTNTAGAEPYRRFSERVDATFGIPAAAPWYKRIHSDMASFAFFQLPLYWANMTATTLALSGTVSDADVKKMAAASASVFLISGLVGGPYGIYKRWLSRSAGVQEPEQP